MSILADEMLGKGLFIVPAPPCQVLKSIGAAASTCPGRDDERSHPGRHGSLAGFWDQALHVDRLKPLSNRPSSHHAIPFFPMNFTVFL